jgi:hypothetical protein
MPRADPQPRVEPEHLEGAPPELPGASRAFFDHLSTARGRLPPGRAGRSARSAAPPRHQCRATRRQRASWPQARARRGCAPG